LGPRYLRQWIQRKAKKGIRDKGLRTKKEELKEELFSEQKKYLREIRYTPMEILVGASLSIYDQKVAFITSSKESFGFVIESTEFSQMMKNIFNLVWNMSQPLTD